MKSNSVCILGGCGHVGLPLAIAFADRGVNVSIYDINEHAVEMVNNGIMPFKEDGAEETLKKVVSKNLTADSRLEIIKDSEFLIIIIGTPVDEHLNPRVDLIDKTIDQIIPIMNDDQIIILRSTLFPGTTKRVHNKIRTMNKEIKVCFCPERIAEGKAMTELFSLPQIVSGFDSESVNKVANLFKLLTKDIIINQPLEAELIKLFTNSWRYISFAIANQFYMIAEEFGVDFYRIYNSMKFNYPRTKDFPKPGFAAGPCLFKDTMQLSAFTNNNFFLGHSAMLVNEGLPNFIVKQLKEKYDLESMKVGILGMAFKAESDDPRESLSYKLRKILKLEAKEVLCSDVFIMDPEFVTEKTLIDSSDLVIIGAPHRTYLKLDLSNKKVYDVWNIQNKVREIQ